MLARVGEGHAVAVIEIGLAGQPLGEEHVVRIELDVEIADLLHLVLHHGGAVDELADRHQYAIDVNGMARRETYFVLGHVLAESMALHANRIDFPRPRMT